VVPVRGMGVRPLRALVTGDAGFVGRHMVNELLARGWDVTGSDIKDGMDCCELFLMDTSRYDLVVHCAYHVGGRAAIDGNPSLFALNLELDARLFEWAVRTKPRAVLYFSSSAAYPVVLQTGNPPRKLAEDDLDLWGVRPDARYGWAKVTGEHLAAAAAESGLRVHVVRPFSGYAGDQEPTEYPFPAIMWRVLRRDMAVWGPPGQCRDWIHIDDVVRGALAVVDADERRPVNLCTGRATEFGDLARLMWQLAVEACPRDIPDAAPPVQYQPDRPTGVMFRVGDPTRMLSIYRPQVTLEEGIRQTLKAVRW